MTEEKNFKIIISYDGTNYAGWQFQPHVSTIQGEIEKALSQIFNEKISICGSGRTDAGVHACGQVANFLCTPKISSDRILHGLNSLLPKDIRILSILEVPFDFNARFSQKTKTYRYRIFNGKILSPFERNYSWHVIKKLDIGKMKSASEYFLGTHDFSAFRASLCTAKNPVRTISKICITQTNDIIEIDFSARAFLYNMVRIMTGAIVHVGKGNAKPEIIGKILRGKNRSKGFVTAPPQGLFLMEAIY